MTVDKRMSYEMQGGMKNYLGKQKMVKAPKYWKSRPDKPQTELAYITKAEKDLIMKSDLHGSLNPNVKGQFAANEGPSGLMSLDYQGDKGTYGQAGQSFGDRERPGQSSTPSGKGSHHPGVGPTKKTTRTVSPKDHFTKSWSGPKGWFGGGGYRDLNVAGDTSQGHKSRFGLGALLKGALGIFGGLPGQLLSGILGAKNWAKNKGQAFGEGVEEFGNYPTLDRYLNRKTDKYKDKPYLGQGKSNYSFDGPTEGNDFGLFTDRQTAPIGPGKRVGQDQGYYGMGSRYDRSRMPSNLSNNLQNNMAQDYGMYEAPNAPSYSMDDQFLDQNPEVRNMLGINRSYTTPVNTNTYEAEPIGFIESLKNKFGEDVTPAAEMTQQDLLNLGAMKPGIAWGHNLTDEGKALEDFRNTAVNMRGIGPTAGQDAKAQFNRMLGMPGLMGGVIENKDFIESALNKGFLADESDWVNQQPLDDYLAKGGRVGYANGGLATLFTRRG